MDIFSKEKRSEIMANVKGKNTKLEIVFRKALWAKGLRYSTNSLKYFGKPDLVLKKYETVIFIDSCFWHGCPIHGETPSTKKKFWKAKLERNKQRDIEVTEYYQKKEWMVIRIWEHDLKNNAFTAVIDSTITILNGK